MIGNVAGNFPGNFRIYQDVPRIMVPMLWFTQKVELDEHLAGQARVILLFNRNDCLGSIFEKIFSRKFEKNRPWFEHVLRNGRPGRPFHCYFNVMPCLPDIHLYEGLENLSSFSIPNLPFSYHSFQLAVMLPNIGVYAAYGILGLGAIILIVGITLSLTKKWNPHSRFQNDSDNELET